MTVYYQIKDKCFLAKDVDTAMNNELGEIINKLLAGCKSPEDAPLKLRTLRSESFAKALWLRVLKKVYENCRAYTVREVPEGGKICWDRKFFSRKK